MLQAEAEQGLPVPKEVSYLLRAGAQVTPSWCVSGRLRRVFSAPTRCHISSIIVLHFLLVVTVTAATLTQSYVLE